MNSSIKDCPEEKLIITPDTKVSDLLAAYPELETVLIELAPAFEKLKNPLLRRTIARVTKLRQAAEIAGMPVGEIVNVLRRAVGQETWQEAPQAEQEAEPENEVNWQDMPIYQTLDARPLLEAGEHPVQQVMRDIESLPAGQRYELITPFMPTPLLDMAKSKGFRTATREEPAGEFHNYIFR